MKAAPLFIALSLCLNPGGASAKQPKRGYEAGGPQAIQALHHDEPGTVTYRGQSRGESFSLKIGPAHGGTSWVAVYVGTNGCLGDVAGQASVQGDVLQFTRDEDGNACSLTIRRSAAGVMIVENDCTFDHGASCSFDTGGKMLHPFSGAKTQAAPVNQYRLKQEAWTGAADDRLSELHLACGDGTVAFTFYLEGYRGPALNKVKDIKQAFVMEIGHSSGDNRKFPLFLYMTPADNGFVQEQSWNFTDGEATAFLDAFGQQGHLSLQTDKGVELASWTLTGTAQIRESIRKGCNL